MRLTLTREFARIFLAHGVDASLLATTVTPLWRLQTYEKRHDGPPLTTLNYMKSLHAQLERNEFSARLKVALGAIGMKPSGTILARQFNLRSPMMPVTAHAVRKWIFGESVPTQDKLKVLGDILGRTPNWLRFGDTTQKSEPLLAHGVIPGDITEMLRDVQRLDSSKRELVETLVQKMLRQQEAQV